MHRVIQMACCSIAFLFTDGVYGAPNLPTLPQPVQRIQLKGFSLQPEDVPGWLVGLHTPMKLAIVRQGVNRDETIAIEAGFMKLNSIKSAADLASDLKTDQIHGMDPSRFTAESNDIKSEQFKGAICVLSHETATDNAPHTQSHSKGSMTLDDLTRTCIDPSNPNYGVYVVYSRRYYPGDADEASAKQAQAVLDSIQFDPSIFGSYDGIIHSTPVSYKTTIGAAQPLELLGGAGDDFSRTILCAQDGSCTLFGYTSGSFSDSMDGWATHLDVSAKVDWAATYGGDNRDTQWKAVRTTDGGYFTIGQSDSGFYTGGLKVFSPEKQGRPMFMKFDSQGKMLWASTIELSSDLSFAQLTYVAETADGGYLLVGTYEEGFPPDHRQPMPGVWSGSAQRSSVGQRYGYPMLMKLSADGKPQWLRRYAIDGDGGYGLSIAEMSSGHLFMSGAVVDGKDEDLFISELDSQGAPLHTQRLAISQHQGTNAVIRLADGDYLVAGHAITDNAPHSAFLVLLAPDLKFLSGTLYQDPSGVRPLGMVQGADGKIVIAGRTENPQANKAEGVAWVVDEKGTDLDELWLSGEGNTELEDVAALSKGGYRLVGDTNAFGAKKYDLVMTTWDPRSADTSMQKRLSLTAYKPDIDDEKTAYDSAKLDIVTPIPSGSFDIRALKPAGDGGH